MLRTYNIPPLVATVVSLLLCNSVQADVIRGNLNLTLLALNTEHEQTSEPTDANNSPVDSEPKIKQTTKPVTKPTTAQTITQTTTQTIKQAKSGKLSYKTLEWTDLIPEDDLDALLNPPSYVTDVEDGSLEDQISNQVQNALAAAYDDRYQQALTSTQVIPELNGQAIRIPGFVVPLEFDDDQTITQFFLVPYFGACIHVPPPPPNQIIFVDYDKGLKLNALYDPFWISGILKTELINNDVATATYSLQMQSYEPYEDF